MPEAAIAHRASACPGSQATSLRGEPWQPRRPADVLVEDVWAIVVGVVAGRSSTLVHPLMQPSFRLTISGW